jgi:phosphoribosylformimino-5-aminoimidazole carboxamide ribotide isomerase
MYVPLSTPLCSDPDPCSVIEKMLGLHPFSTFYLADIDALMGQPKQTKLITDLCRRFSSQTFWLDSGFKVQELCEENIRPVIGSEYLTAADLKSIEAKSSHSILSLDHQDGRFLGPPELIECPKSWPQTIIWMDLSRVGSNEGPCPRGLMPSPEVLAGRHMIAAGGVRDDRDLLELEAQGVDGVLVASALHYGRLSQAALQK